jgi:hypothetical protein
VAIAIGDLPTNRPLRVTATPTSDWDWENLRIVASDHVVEGSRVVGSIGVDYARFAFADADALGTWVHDDSIDGLANVVSGAE